MEELNLLVDAIKQLDELFLLVIVGEFNSGKSSIINALLGDKFLAEGILPTTNEISVLKFRCTTSLHLRNHKTCLDFKVFTLILSQAQDLHGLSFRKRQWSAIIALKATRLKAEGRNLYSAVANPVRE